MAGRAGRILVFLLPLVPSPALGDGGMLEFGSIPATETLRPHWFADSPAWYSHEQATLTLDQGKPEDVLVVGDPESSLRMYVTQSTPYRLFCDLNGDNEPQPEEIYTATESRIFRNVAVPRSLGDTPQRILVDIRAYIGSGYCSLSVNRISSCYAGTLSVAGREYPARLEFRSTFSVRDGSDRVVLLDGDRDGSFDPLFDPWFASNGFAYLDGALWTASTTFSGSQAEVTLEPYPGTRGKLKIEGEGIHRVHLSIDPEVTRFARGPYPRELCLPGTEDRTYSLPSRRCLVTDVWLHSPVDPELFYRLEAARGFALRHEADIVADSTVTLALGGPLTAKIGASVLRASLTGRVQLDFKGCRNPSGLEFTPIRYGTSEGEPEDAWYDTRRNPPKFEIRDRRRNLVASGSFEYG